VGILGMDQGVRRRVATLGRSARRSRGMTPDFCYDRCAGGTQLTALIGTKRRLS
jgi:hypothetical protein